MPIEFTWLVPDRILLLCWSGSVTTQDMNVLIDELDIVYAHAAGPVHAVIDMYGLERLDHDIAFTFINHAMFDDPYRGDVALVRLPERYLPLVGEANQLVDRPFLHVFKTRHDAQAFLLGLDGDDDVPPETN